MSEMTTHKRTQRHAATEAAPKRDHLWVLVIIAGFALYDVWTAWSQIGNKAGFAHGTGWTLTVIVEVFWLYVLWAWLGGAVGLRSRKFARRSAAGVFVLSLVGQASSRLSAHRVPPPAVVVFVSVLPVIVLALVAFLVHFRQLDRTEAAAAERDAAAGQAAEEAIAADERIALRAQLEAEREAAQSAREALMSELAAVQADRGNAQRELAEALRRAEALAKKLAAKSAPKARERERDNAQSEDLTIELRALKLLDDEPALRQSRMGGELARKLGVSPATGRRLHGRLTAQGRPADPLGERSAEQSAERSSETGDRT